MRILLAHNYYRQPGGEDVVFESERDLLREKGHTVVDFTVHNSSIQEKSRIQTGLSSIWSFRSAGELKHLLASEEFDVAHFHNTFPLLSASAYHACRDAGVPVVQSLHNFRWLCPSATFYRDGNVCEECTAKVVPYPSVVHACYHESRLQTLAVAGMITFHRMAGTLQDGVSVFVAPTHFLRDKFVQSNFPPAKVVVKPYFVSPDPGGREHQGHGAMFLGRLSEEKGVRTMMKAWESLVAVPLKIVGQGPLEAEVRKSMESNSGHSVVLVGHRNQGEVIRLLKDSSFLVVPSECYEASPRVILEAFACGVPVIVSSHGAMKELVKAGVHGIHFEPGNEVDLGEKVMWAYQHPEEMVEMGRNARREYEKTFTADRNHDILLEIYREAIQSTGKVTQ